MNVAEKCRAMNELRDEIAAGAADDAILSSLEALKTISESGDVRRGIFIRTGASILTPLQRAKLATGWGAGPQR
jgi:hypothetical protein